MQQCCVKKLNRWGGGGGGVVRVAFMFFLRVCSLNRRCPRVLNSSVTYCCCDVTVSLIAACSFPLVTTTFSFLPRKDV